MQQEWFAIRYIGTTQRALVEAHKGARRKQEEAEERINSTERKVAEAIEAAAQERFKEHAGKRV